MDTTSGKRSKAADLRGFSEIGDLCVYIGQIVGIWTQLAFLMHFEVGILTRFSQECAHGLERKLENPPCF